MPGRCQYQESWLEEEVWRLWLRPGKNEFDLTSQSIIPELVAVVKEQQPSCSYHSEINPELEAHTEKIMASRNIAMFDNLENIVVDPELSDLERHCDDLTTSPPRTFHEMGSLTFDADLSGDDIPEGSESDDSSEDTSHEMFFVDDVAHITGAVGSADEEDFLGWDLPENMVGLQTRTLPDIDTGLPGPSHATPARTIQTKRRRVTRTQIQSPVVPWVRAYPPEKERDIASRFTVQNVGPRNVPVSSNPIAFLYLFMTHAMWALMVEETNKFAQAVLRQRRDSGNLKPCSRISEWVDVTINEMKKFWGMLINMGLTPRKNVVEYWSNVESQIISFYPKLMTLRRFELIMSMFHLSSIEDPGHDSWNKIRTFVDMMNDAFKAYFVPSQEVCIDESMIGMKNRCAFIQYMPNKRHSRFGIKKFEIFDLKTSYILHVSMYNGKNFLANDPDPFTQKVVKDLMTKADCLGKGYHLFTDNYYTKVPLSSFLLSNNTFLTGTINKISKELPRNIVEAELSAGESLYFRRGETLLLKYKEKKSRKPLLLLTTGCHAANTDVHNRWGGTKSRPFVIHEYNSFMAGVNNKDKGIYHVTCSRACQKYWRKIVYNFIDMAIFNAWILYKSQNSNVKKTWHSFMVDLVQRLCYAPDLDASPAPGLSGMQLCHAGPSTSTATSSATLPSHILTKLPKGGKKVCAVCFGVEVGDLRSRFWCPACNIGVHRKCFMNLNHYWRSKLRRT